MKCTIYRSRQRDFTYLFLPEDGALEELPEGLRALFANAERVMALELSADRPLAQEDPARVMENLRRDGYHLQLPPTEDPSGWLDLPGR
ncbi:MAG: YcgL domain-containing protein [Gammaproteobacteria bacterium]